MNNLKEYIVTAKDRETLDSLCYDIETEGGDLYIPNRAVEIANLRPLSRNTHYYLTDEEANLLKKDPRVLAVELTPNELGLVVRPSYDQTESFWDKSLTDNSSHKNWGLLRCTEGAPRNNWGSNGTASQSGTVKINAQGRNVDVVIVDGHFNPAHPEFAVNADGTGGSRVVQYNWFQHNPTVTGQPAGVYVYTPYDDGATARTDDNNHGAHVAGTVAGNTQGWARKSNIYNISPYSTNPNSFDALFLFDYIREFHKSKPINPNTGVKNPTICNNSWGYGYELSVGGVTSLIYRGTVVASPTGPSLVNGNILRQYGVFNNNSTMYIPSRYPAIEADIEDAIADGIIMIGAASNDYTKIDLESGPDYNNKVVWNGFDVYYHRGSSPSSATGVICVGAVGALVDESKATFSNCGPRVDIYAPGSNIMSSVNSTTSFGGVNDPRNGSYKLAKISGTSMASPQVCGVAACVLETYPKMTQSEMLAYLLSQATNNQITDTGGGYDDYTSLQGSNNKILYYYHERPTTGNAWPKLNYNLRPASAAVYPRPRIKRTL